MKYHAITAALLLVAIALEMAGLSGAGGVVFVAGIAFEVWFWARVLVKRSPANTDRHPPPRDGAPQNPLEAEYLTWFVALPVTHRRARTAMPRQPRSHRLQPSRSRIGTPSSRSRTRVRLRLIPNTTTAT